MSFVNYEQDEHVCVITLNRPERLNAMSPEMKTEFLDAMRTFEETESARVAILTGAGRSFCAGRDLKSQAEGYAQGDGKMVPLHYNSEYNLFGMPDTNKPIVAAVNGFAMGLGWYMVLDCDIRVAAAGAQFAMSEVPTGALGPYWLAGTDIMPWPVAAEIAMIGDRLPAERLLALNLLNAVVPPEELMDEAMRWAKKIAALPPQHVQQTKKLMRQMRSLPDQDMARQETEARLFLGPREDSREAVLAWTERRPAHYTGR
ncbi:MAG TPA: enoyl-CoA hydratase/isomerase family protein [Streptosporangiaceae bacterium]|jgi:enoyl-CoA hydratase/carnithine racemase